MKADKYGTPREQMLWIMGYLKPNDRDSPISGGCVQCNAVAITSHEGKKKLTCIYYGGDTFTTSATAICKKFQEITK